MQDASGLSPADTTTCAAMLAVLVRQPSGGPLWSALPVAGAKGGTLSDAFTQAPLGGVLRAKTGTLQEGGVKALAGYRPVDGGGDAQFVLILNGPSAADRPEYLPRWEALGSALAGYPAGPTPAELAP
jgi:D-alanyl-D-alanine carboxypeptidase/D-alanyl-D-alanine-endopeptidase (penicillin-binding protein 4)